VVFHRLGDLGYIDADGRLWFVGRKVETVYTARGPLYPAQVEPLFDSHPEIRRVALVSSGSPGRHRPCLVAEPVNPKLLPDSAECRRLTRDLRQIALSHEHTAQIKTFYFHPSFPVDVRHNAKIHRLALARWVADGATGFESDPKR
jgi:acyl-coenzyme A synthetase/AMP-(fatty) acid ligase